MASKLSLYNQALRELGSRKLASLSEAVETRYHLDDVYDAVLAECLEEGQWNFATRAVEIEHEASIDPAFGFEYAFARPDDFVRLMAISADDTFSAPLQNYTDEANYWLADVSPLYIKYVSNDVGYGMDLGKWPVSFERYVVLTLANRIAPSVTQSETRTDYLFKMARRAKINARSKDAMGQPAGRIVPGSWAQSRFGGDGISRRYDRG